MSWAKLDAGRVSYYSNSVADNRESYYQGRGEAAGRYLGEGARLLGLAGEVDGGGLTALAEGRHPVNGERITEHATTIGAYDFTFSAPKSVSLLYASGETALAGKILDAHERAVDTSIRVLEREAAFVRRGKGGAVVQRADGLVVSAYRHRTSRAGDPNLHTHAVIASMGRGRDGRWTALHSVPLRDFKMALGAIYRAELRANVREDLGLRWGPLDAKGLSELECVNRSTLRAFSKRRIEIEDVARGSTESARAMAGAALTTRRAKREVDWPAVQAEVARALGQERIATIRGEVQSGGGEQQAAVPIDHARLAGPEGLTQMRNTFRRQDVIQAMARSAPQGMRASDVIAQTDRFLERADVLAVGGDRWTTQDLVDAERAREQAQLGRAGERACVVTDRTLRRGTTGVTLNDGQRHVVEAIFKSGRGVEVVQALAGTGKTYTAGALRAIAEEDGRQVIGVAPTARAARELREQAGIENSYTLETLLLKLDNAAVRLGARDLVVFDEASMTGTRPAARLEQYAQAAGAKVVEIGDRGQLQAVLAGGELAGIHEQLGGLELAEVVRQNDPEEIRALGALHGGHSEFYIDWAQLNGRITIGATAEQAVAAYQRNVAEVGYEQTVLIAPTNAMCRYANEVVRADRRERGELGKEQTLGDLEVAVGDRVICKSNDRMIDVINSDRGTVTGLHGAGVEIQLDGSGYRRTIPGDYVEDGHLQHAYCQTGHSVQGATVERAVVVGQADQLYQEWSYVAASRARDTTHVYVLDPAAVERERDEIGPTDRDRTRDLRAELVKTMSESSGEDLAVDQLDRGREPAQHDRGLDRDIGLEDDARRVLGPFRQGREPDRLGPGDALKLDPAAPRIDRGRDGGYGLER